MLFAIALLLMSFGQVFATQKPIVAVVTSYNNAKWYQKNLDTLFDQDYQNYRVIYVDDASSDGTGDLVQAYINSHDLQQRLTLVRNATNMGALYNLYHAIHSCDDNEIIATVDGDDWLSHRNVFRAINDAYQNDNVWMTYGQYRRFPGGKIGHCRAFPQNVIAENSYRYYAWISSQLRTFYAGLFKQIALEDLQHDGSFIPIAWDLAIMFPLLEMSAGRHKCISDVLYIYNRQNALNDDKVHGRQRQLYFDRLIRQKPRYAPLEHAWDTPTRTQSFAKQADLVAFSYNRPLQLYAFLESLYQFTSGLGEVTVIYRSDSEYVQGYEEVQESFPSVRMVQQGAQPKEDFKPLTLEYSFKTPSNYIIYAVDDIIVKDEIDLSACIAALEARDAYGFYLRCGKGVTYSYMRQKDAPVPAYNEVAPGVYQWRFSGISHWNYPHSVDMTLFKKGDIEAMVRKLRFANPNTFERVWSRVKPTKTTGLFFEQSKIVNIPLNLVQDVCVSNNNMQSYSPQELNELFTKGLKMDIEPLFGIKNNSPHIDFDVTFIER